MPLKLPCLKQDAEADFHVTLNNQLNRFVPEQVRREKCSQFHAIFVLLTATTACDCVDEEAEDKVEHDYVDRSQVHNHIASREVSLVPSVILWFFIIQV